MTSNGPQVIPAYLTHASTLVMSKVNSCVAALASTSDGLYQCTSLPDVSALSTRTILAVLYTAFIAQWFGQWAWFRSLQLLPANVAAIGSLSIPIVGLYASAVLLEESITWIELMALAMVLVALGLVLIGRDGLNALKRRHHK